MIPRTIFRVAAAAAAVLALAGGRASNAAPARSLYVAPAGSDAGVCTQADPCASFDRAYSLATPGATVLVAAGRYGAQDVRAHPGRHGANVVVRPATKAPVTVTALTVTASRIEFRDLTVIDLEVPRDANDVTFRRIKNHGFFVQGATNISFIGGDVTCGLCSFHPHLDDGGPPDFRPPRNIVLDDMYFHDWQASTPGQHTECLQILAGDGITIRNSVFKNCGTANDGRGATAALQVSWLGNGPKTRNVLIENNFFYRSGNLYEIQSGDYHGLRIRYNSFDGPILVGGGWGDGTTVELVGNIMRFSGCSAPPTGSGPVSKLVFRYNVLDGGACGPTDTNAPGGFLDPAANLHLRSGAAAINRGEPTGFPRRDIDGQARPRGGRPDAGADEAR
jgi:hypothetical protein